MDSTFLASSSSFLPFSNAIHRNPTPRSSPFSLSLLPSHPKLPPSKLSICASLSSSYPTNLNPLSRTLRTAAGTLIFTAAAALLAARLGQAPARAEPPLPPSSSDSVTVDVGRDYGGNGDVGRVQESSPLTQLLETSSEFVDSLKELLKQKLENGEDEEALEVLKKLVTAQPKEVEWKFLTGRVLSEMGKNQDAREVFEEILDANPLSFEALFENALLMDRCGEREAVLARLEKALRVAEEEGKAKEARDVRFIIAQIQFLQKNVEEALNSYEELAKEDPKDFRPYFCKGMIYSLLDRNPEAREQFAKYRELSPRKFEVEGYLRTPLSRMKLFGGDES